MNSPVFSVIIPVFNRPMKVTRALDSVLNQSFKDFELIIIDDGSTDETKSVLKSFCENHGLPEITLISLAHNKGVSYARNVGAKKARGSYLAFLDSDDEWVSTKLKKQYDYLMSNKDCVILHTDELWMRNDRRVNERHIHKKGGGDQFKRSIDLCVISPSAVVLEKATFLELGMFREDFPVCEDYDLWLKYTSLFEVGHLKQRLVIKYGGHEDQLSHKFHSMDYWRVISILWVLKHRKLDSEKLNYAFNVLDKKSNILFKGYEKYNRWESIKQLKVLLSPYQKKLTKTKRHFKNL